ncbi:membrane protein insertase YidC [Actinoplanes sp. NPDC049316]|uniref:YidC/Oxa1 family membrane protein insertase n=1 Tax=Actinoplanes sp. NPDC049316 TaxID=3154727 RepID=UPI0034320A09
MSIFVDVARSCLEGLAALLVPSAGVFAAALAIVLFTMAVRLLISPLSRLQARSARRSAALAPELAALREKHRGDPATLATETLALQRARGVSPYAAVLPALAQAPFFMLMYHVVQPGAGAPTGVLAGRLFGVPLTEHLLSGLPVFAVLLTLAGLLAWWSSRRVRQSMAPDAPLRRVLAGVPYLSVAAVAWLPLAGALYLVTSSAWTAAEQLILRR